MQANVAEASGIFVECGAPHEAIEVEFVLRVSQQLVPKRCSAKV